VFLFIRGIAFLFIITVFTSSFKLMLLLLSLILHVQLKLRLLAVHRAFRTIFVRSKLLISEVRLFSLEMVNFFYLNIMKIHGVLNFVHNRSEYNKAYPVYYSVGYYSSTRSVIWLLIYCYDINNSGCYYWKHIYPEW
jgi:hypothetical protein